jgi:hypothetical protein
MHWPMLANKRRPQSVVGRSMCGTPIAYLIGSGRCGSHYLFCIMAPPQHVKQPRGVAKRRRWRRRRRAMAANGHTPPEWDKARKCWIPADIVQNTAEYLGCVPSLLSFRGVSTGWQGAVSDAVGFLNGRCWNHLKVKFRGQYNCSEVGPLWIAFHLDDAAVIARCAMLCLARRLETLEWPSGADQIDYEHLVTRRLTASEWSYALSKMRYRTVDVSCLRNCPVLKNLDLFYNRGVTDAGIRGLERVPTLEDLDLSWCKQVTDVSFLRSCLALKKLNVTFTSVTDAGIRGLEFIPTLEDLDLSWCQQITDVSFLRNCLALKKLDLSKTSVTDAGILGLEFISTLQGLILYCCEQITDVSCLQNSRALKTLNLCRTSATDAGIRGLELIPTLEMLNLASGKQVHFPAISADLPSSTVDSCPTANRLFLLR